MRPLKITLIVLGALLVLFVGVGLYGVYGPVTHSGSVYKAPSAMVQAERAEARCRRSWLKWGFVDANGMDITREHTKEGWRFYGNAVTKDGHHGYVDCLITFVGGHMSMLNSTWRRR